MVGNSLIICKRKGGRRRRQETSWTRKRDERRREGRAAPDQVLKEVARALQRAREEGG
jgi:hypothetical protein